MRHPLLSFTLMALFGFAAGTTVGFADEGHPDGKGSTAANQSGHAHHDVHGHDVSPAGRPGDPGKISRTIKITAMDIRYDKPAIRIKAGETIKFVVTNAGKLRHEFMLGDAGEQRAHAEMMKEMPDMVHSDPNMVTVEPGETKILVWHFTRAGKFEAACHIPGHYEAGMKSELTVRR